MGCRVPEDIWQLAGSDVAGRLEDDIFVFARPHSLCNIRVAVQWGVHYQGTDDCKKSEGRKPQRPIHIHLKEL